jgi:Beta protein
MLEIQSTFYTPVLRLKQGEYLGLAGLAEDVKACILPHLILPPRMERDPEKERPLTPDELISETTKRIGTCWAVRPCLVDTRFFDGASDGGLPRVGFRVSSMRSSAIEDARSRWLI